MSPVFIEDIMPYGLLTEMIEDGYIRRFEHDNGDLVGFNYTERAQWGRVWNDATRNCRGLIVDTDGRIVARPFPKFFNWGDDPDSDAEYATRPCVLHEKVDGSLGIHYQWEGEQFVATRGSFVSPQAVWATEWARNQTLWFGAVDTHTALFEIVYPENRIVVDYGDRAELVFLGLLDNATARRVPTPGLRLAATAELWDMPLDEALTTDVGNFEGFVAEWDDGHRVKIKLPEYLRLHRIMAATSNRTIWEALSAGTGIEPMLEATPDEFQQWVLSEAGYLKREFFARENLARRVFAEIHDDSEDRKAFAEKARRFAHPAQMFALLDGKPIDGLIWKTLRPETIERPLVAGEAA